MPEARRRLAAGAAIAEVAFATGFADQSHLTRWFRRTYGITRTSTNRRERPGLTRRTGQADGWQVVLSV